ncbi:unnamed protein product [Durusdinium trenchii]|uniref:Uncharacterized protein n=1 Tax=Durusdinium trenchii TaxID=1381693 RepID=A0ABP0HL83_9DINO
MSGFINFNSFDVKKALKRKKGQISSDSDSEQQAKAKAKPKAKPKAQPEAVPLHQLAATATDLSGVAVVSRFLASALAEWRRLRPSSETLEKLQASERTLVASEPPSAEVLQPLVDLVEMRAPDDPESSKVEQVCRMSLANEHLAAERARALDYASLIGQKKCFCMLGQIDRLEQVCFYGDRSLETNPQSLSTIQ